MPSSPVALVVEDNSLLRTLQSAILARAGFQVRTAADGLAALEDLRHGIPDLILSDLEMPRMSGFEFLSIVRRRYPAIPVLATSGSYTGYNVPAGVAADAFYPKGTSITTFLQLVSRLTAPNSPFLAFRRSVPIWTDIHPASFSTLTQCLITCPECLRAFPHTVSNPLSALVEIHCPHCSTDTPYAFLVPGRDPPSTRLSWWRGPPLFAGQAAQYR